MNIIVVLLRLRTDVIVNTIQCEIVHAISLNTRDAECDRITSTLADIRDDYTQDSLRENGGEAVNWALSGEKAT